MGLINQLKRTRRASVPLIAIETPDPASTVETIKAVYVNGDSEPPIVQWDIIRGGMAVTEAADQLASDVGQCGPADFASALAGKEDAVGIMLGASEFISDPATIQAVWNLRDPGKAGGTCLVMLGPIIELPAALRHDVVVLDEELPDSGALARIAKTVDTCWRESTESDREPVSDDQVDAAVEAVLGLSAFAAEQALAMSMSMNGDGYNLDELWSRKRKLIGQTRGLSVYRGGETFADLGGLEPVKAYLRGVMTGRQAPNVICWLDEVEKTGLSAHCDTSGVSQDQEGTLLSWMEDRDIYGVMLLGVPGAGKSATCKATGAEFGRPVVRVDLGAMQGSLVGESQTNLRQALKTAEAVSGGADILVLATSNSVDGLSAAMRSRFVDTFFFDLPTDKERGPIWRVWLNKFPDVTGLPPDVKDDGWVGRNIRRCVEKAWRLNVPLEEAAKTIVPVGSVEKDEIERLRQQAAGRYLSASRPGVYRMPDKTQTRRKMR